MIIRRRVCPEAEKREVNHTDFSSVCFWSLSIQKFSKMYLDISGKMMVDSVSALWMGGLKCQSWDWNH